jgi:hypothetical protein
MRWAIGAPELVVPRRRDGVVLPGQMFDRETDRDRLLITGVLLLGSVRFAGLCSRLGADDIFHAGKLQPVTVRRTPMKYGAVSRDSAPNSPARSTTALIRSPSDSAAIGCCRVQHEQPAGEQIGSHHLRQHRHRHPRVMAQPTHPPVAGIKRIDTSRMIA